MKPPGSVVSLAGSRAESTPPPPPTTLLSARHPAAAHDKAGGQAVVQEIIVLPDETTMVRPLSGGNDEADRLEEAVDVLLGIESSNNHHRSAVAAKMTSTSTAGREKSDPAGFSQIKPVTRGAFRAPVESSFLSIVAFRS